MTVISGKTMKIWRSGSSRGKMWQGVACLVLMVAIGGKVGVVAQNSPSDYLRVHNAARDELGLPHLQWNSTMLAYAQNYANQRSFDCSMEHSQGPYGENIAQGFGAFSGAEAVDFWLTEKPYYDYTSNQCVGDVCGHYTQIIWKNTKYVGCTRVSCRQPEGGVFIICNYDPPGNYVGERPY